MPLFHQFQLLEMHNPLCQVHQRAVHARPLAKKMKTKGTEMAQLNGMGHIEGLTEM